MIVLVTLSPWVSPTMKSSRKATMTFMATPATMNSSLCQNGMRVVAAIERGGGDLVGAQRPWPGQPVLRVLRAPAFLARQILLRPPLRLLLPGLGDAGLELLLVHAGHPHVAAQRKQEMP